MRTGNVCTIHAMAHALATMPTYDIVNNYSPYQPWGTRYRGSSNMKRKTTNAQRKNLRRRQKASRKINRRNK